jgi:hypothetical protein
VVVRIDVVGRERLRAVGAIMAAESDGWQLKRDLAAGLRLATEPIIDDEKARVRSIPSRGITEGAPIRERIVDSLNVSVRFSGYAAGVVIRAGQTDDVRNFRNAPRRFNARGGFRHPTFGHDPWVTQRGDPGWFSEPPFAHAEQLTAACLGAIVRMEARIAARARAVP